jgi:hypothetical protein
MFTVFFARHSPDSTDANPRCMMKTRKVDTIIQVLFTTNPASATTSSAGSATSCAHTAGPHNNATPSTAHPIFFMTPFLSHGFSFRTRGFTGTT